MTVIKTIIKMKNAMDTRQKIGDIHEYQFLSAFDVMIPSFDDEYDVVGFEKGTYLIEVSGNIYRIIDDCLVYITYLKSGDKDHHKIAEVQDGDVFVMNNSGVYKKLTYDEINELVDPTHLYPLVPGMALVENGKVHPYFKYGQH